MKDECVLAKLDAAMSGLKIATKEYSYSFDKTYAIGLINDVIADLEDVVKRAEQV